MLLAASTGNTPGTPSVTVVAKSGSIQEDMIFTVTGDGIRVEGDITTCVIHFSVPPSKWWADVRYACSTIQVFRDQAEATEWVRNVSCVVQFTLLMGGQCRQYGFNPGETIDLDTMWKLAKVRRPFESKTLAYG